MPTTVIPGLKQYTLIIRGPRDEMLSAFYHYLGGGRPVHNVRKNGQYDSFHVEAWVENSDVLLNWYTDRGHWNPGSLLFYIGEDK